MRRAHVRTMLDLIPTLRPGPPRSVRGRRLVGVAGVTVIVAVGCAQALAAGDPGTGGGTPQIISAPRFVVSGDGSSWAFSELTGITAEVEPHEFDYIKPKGLNVEMNPKQFGKRKPPMVTLTGPLDSDTTLWGWHLSVRAGAQNARHDVLLTVSSADPSNANAHLLQYELVNAWPAKMELSGARAGSTQIANVTVTFEADAIIPAPSGQPVIPVSEAGKIRSGKAAIPAAGPTTPHGTPSVLNAVSCASATACIAVGREVVGHVNRPLVEQWNGSYWASQTAPMPAGASGAILNGVSCLTATDCTAVGAWHNATGTHTLAEAWNGSAWSVQTTVDVAGAPSTVLSGVSCQAAASCVAVGTAAGPQQHFAIAETSNGATWQPQPMPRPTPQGPYATSLTSVSCTSPSACTAVGADGASPLAASWDGTHWTLETPTAPAGATATMLRSVTCQPGGDCIAVGSATSSSGTTAVAELTNGSTWSLETVPTPAGTHTPILRSVSCLAANSCAAVGSIINPRYGLKLLLERWNGVTWAKVASPDPAGETGTAFTGVSCATACAAVGGAAKPSLTALMQILATS